MRNCIFITNRLHDILKKMSSRLLLPASEIVRQAIYSLQTHMPFSIFSTPKPVTVEKKTRDYLFCLHLTGEYIKFFRNNYWDVERVILANEYSTLYPFEHLQVQYSKMLAHKLLKINMHRVNSHSLFYTHTTLAGTVICLPNKELVLPALFIIKTFGGKDIQKIIQQLDIYKSDNPTIIREMIKDICLKCNSRIYVPQLAMA